MDDETNKPVMVEVLGVNESELASLREAVLEAGGQAGAVARTATPSDLNLSQEEVGLLFKLLIAITEAVLPKLTEWALKILDRKPAGEPPTVIVIRGKRVEISSGADPNLVKSVIRAAFQKHGPV